VNNLVPEMIQRHPICRHTTDQSRIGWCLHTIQTGYSSHW